MFFRGLCEFKDVWELGFLWVGYLRGLYVWGLIDF